MVTKDKAEENWWVFCHSREWRNSRISRYGPFVDTEVEGADIRQSGQGQAMACVVALAGCIDVCGAEVRFCDGDIPKTLPDSFV